MYRRDMAGIVGVSNPAGTFPVPFCLNKPIVGPMFLAHICQ